MGVRCWAVWVWLAVGVGGAWGRGTGGLNPMASYAARLLRGQPALPVSPPALASPDLPTPHVAPSDLPLPPAASKPSETSPIPGAFSPLPATEPPLEEPSSLPEAPLPDTETEPKPHPLASLDLRDFTDSAEVPSSEGPHLSTSRPKDQVSGSPGDGSPSDRQASAETKAVDQAAKNSTEASLRPVNHSDALDGSGNTTDSAFLEGTSQATVKTLRSRVEEWFRESYPEEELSEDELNWLVEQAELDEAARAEEAKRVKAGLAAGAREGRSEARVDEAWWQRTGLTKAALGISLVVLCTVGVVLPVLLVQQRRLARLYSPATLEEARAARAGAWAAAVQRAHERQARWEADLLSDLRPVTHLPPNALPHHSDDSGTRSAASSSTQTPSITSPAVSPSTSPLGDLRTQTPTSATFTLISLPDHSPASLYSSSSSSTASSYSLPAHPNTNTPNTPNTPGESSA